MGEILINVPHVFENIVCSGAIGYSVLQYFKDFKMHIIHNLIS